MKKYNFLSKEEINKLSEPHLFYNISDINYSFKINKTSDYYNNINKDRFISKNEKPQKSIELSTSYEPVFGIFKNIYSSSIKRFKSYIFEYNSNKKNPNDKKCIILVHGFQSRKKEIYLQMGKRFALNNIDGIVYYLPFHFERKYKGGYENDVLNMDDFRATLEFFRQTVIELSILVRVLKKIGYGLAGILGFSFGAYCCSLLACIDRAVDFVIPIASMGDFGKLFKFKKGYSNMDLNNRKDKINKFLVSKYLKLICPINYRPVIDIDRILFIQGLIDVRAPVKDVLKLKRKWKNPKVIWYPCDHFTFFLFNRLTLRLAVKFINNLKI